MPDEAQKNETITMPHTWLKALEIWDSGGPVPAFEVESEGASQDRLWGAAFSILRGEEFMPSPADFTVRETDTVKSIAHVAKLVSWPQMIISHVSATAVAILIRNPEPRSK